MLLGVRWVRKGVAEKVGGSIWPEMERMRCTRERWSSVFSSSGLGNHATPSTLVLKEGGKQVRGVHVAW